MNLNRKHLWIYRITTFKLLLLILIQTEEINAQSQIDPVLSESQHIVGILYGTGNFRAGFRQKHSFADKISYQNIVFFYSRNYNNRFNYLIKYELIRNTEKGFGSCEGTTESYYSKDSEFKSLWLSSRLTIRYIGLKFRLVYFSRTAGYCDENPTNEGIYPSVGIDFGLLNKIFLNFDILEDSIFYPYSVGINFIPKSLFRIISLEYIASNNNGLVLKTDLNISKKFIIMINLLTFSDFKTIGSRFGIGCTF